MSKPGRNDISIAKDHWITFISVEGRQEGAADVGFLIAPMKSFWSLLETECDSACCGIDAFNFWPEAIRDAAAKCGCTDLSGQMIALRRFVEESKASVVVSSFLNQYLDRQVALQLIDHVICYISTK